MKEKEQSDEKCTKLKQLLVKAKKEVSDAKTHEAEHLSNDVQLKAQLENALLEIENLKVNKKKYTPLVFNLRLRTKRTRFRLRCVNNLLYFVSGTAPSIEILIVSLCRGRWHLKPAPID